MSRVFIMLLICVTVGACASPFLTAKTGRINRPVSTVWVGEDKFVYVPGPLGRNFEFETANSGRIIRPGLMYTDGGSIPRFAQIFKGFSPWGFGPAYIVHDWIFYARHCYVDRYERDKKRYEDHVRFADIYGSREFRDIDFHESATILAEVIKTIIDYGDVRPKDFPATVISSAVDSTFALALWNEVGACNRQRVSPEHIALVWARYNGGVSKVPDTWRLSSWEKREAFKHLAKARRLVGPIKHQPKQLIQPGPVAQLTR